MDSLSFQCNKRYSKLIRGPTGEALRTFGANYTLLGASGSNSHVDRQDNTEVA